MKRYTGAVDIGGTKIRVGIVDHEGNVLQARTFPTIKGIGGAQESCEKIFEILKDACIREHIAYESLEGIGIVCAGPVDVSSGSVENPYTLSGWEGFPICSRLQEIADKKVYLENDANGMLLGEVKRRKLRDKRVLMITFGTGIGVACYVNNGMYSTGYKYHPEMGHVVVEQGGEECYCGHRGCFESLCSGTALNRLAQESGLIDFDNAYHKGTLGNTRAVEFMNKTRRRICCGIWNLAVIFQPDVLVVGGGIAERYFQFIEQAVREDTKGLTDFVREMEILKAEGNGDSALIGASALVFGG